QSIEKIASFTLSVVGRVASPFGATRSRPFAAPATTRTSVRFARVGSETLDCLGQGGVLRPLQQRVLLEELRGRSPHALDQFQVGEASDAEGWEPALPQAVVLAGAPDAQ